MVTNTIRASLLALTLLASPSMIDGQNYAPPAKPVPVTQAVTQTHKATHRIVQYGDQVRLVQNTDTTAMTAKELSEYRPAQRTLASQLTASQPAKSQSVRSQPVVSQSVTPRSIADDCVTCPPDLGPLMPAKVYSIAAVGDPVGTTVMTLEERCERIAGTYTDCLYPDEQLVVKQPLLKRQHRLIDAGKAKFEYFVNWDKDLSREQNKANRAIWRDGVATFDELALHGDVLPKNAEGKPYSQVTLVPRLSAPGVEDCSYGIKLRADLCEKEVPPPVVELPPPVVETPPPVVETPPPVVEVPPAVPPITAIPPIQETNPWYARAVAGTTGLASSLDWNKPPNEYCPSDLCRGSFADHTLEGKTGELEVGYKQPDFTAALSAQKTEMDVETLNVSHGSLRKYFESTGVEARDITLKARGAFDMERIGIDSPLQPYIAGEITKGDITLKDASTSRTDDMDAYQGTLGIKAGDFTKTFGYLGAGYRVFDQPHLLSAPTFNASVPATIEIRTPVAEAGGQVSLFNNRWDVFGDALYLFNSEADDVKLENRVNYTLGTNIWVKNTGSWNLGITGDYSNHDPMKLDLPGNPPALQNLVPDDTIRGGITIRW